MRIRKPVAAAVIVALVGVVVVAAQRGGSTEAPYVTAVAANGSITQSLTTGATVQRDDQVVLDFSTTSMVTSVDVRIGDQVHPGQRLATIDTAPLRLAVLQATAQVAQREAQLEADLKAQDAAETASVGAPNIQGPAADPAAQGPAAQGPAPDTATGAAPEAPAYLTDMTNSLATMQAAVVAQQTACQPVFAAAQMLQQLGITSPASPDELAPVEFAQPTATPSATTVATDATTTTSDQARAHKSTSTPAASTNTAPTRTCELSRSSGCQTIPTAIPTSLPSGLPSGLDPSLPPSMTEAELAALLSQVEGCSTAMVGLAAAEGAAGLAISTAAQELALANAQAAAALAQAQAELEAAAKAASEQAMSAAQAQLEGLSLAGMGGMVTEATIAGDRAELLRARQALSRAEADLAGATMTSPVSGTVGALTLRPGESSAGQTITLVSGDAATLTLDVPLTVRQFVSQGMSAKAGLVGAGTALGGRVNTVAVLQNPGAGTPSYRTTVVVQDPGQVLKSGSRAEVSLELKSVTDTLTVPISAVTKVTDTTGTVQTVDSDRATQAQQITVITGTHGGGRIQILSGLQAGDVVVLADRRLPVPGGVDQYTAMEPTATPS